MAIVLSGSINSRSSMISARRPEHSSRAALWLVGPYVGGEDPLYSTLHSVWIWFCCRVRVSNERKIYDIFLPISGQGSRRSSQMST